MLGLWATNEIGSVSRCLCTLLPHIFFTQPSIRLKRLLWSRGSLLLTNSCHSSDSGNSRSPTPNKMSLRKSEVLGRVLLNRLGSTYASQSSKAGAALQIRAFASMPEPVQDGPIHAKEGKVMHPDLLNAVSRHS
jgi:hypothetical protein